MLPDAVRLEGGRPALRAVQRRAHDGLPPLLVVVPEELVHEKVDVAALVILIHHVELKRLRAILRIELITRELLLRHGMNVDVLLPYALSTLPF